MARGVRGQLPVGLALVELPAFGLGRDDREPVVVDDHPRVEDLLDEQLVGARVVHGRPDNVRVL